MFLYQDLARFGNGTDMVEICYDSDPSNYKVMSNMASYFFHIYEVHALDSDGNSDYSRARRAPGAKLSEEQKHSVVMQFEAALFHLQSRYSNTLDGRMIRTPGVLLSLAHACIISFEDQTSIIRGGSFIDLLE